MSMNPENQLNTSTGPKNGKTPENSGVTTLMAEGVGFEPTDELPHLLISSQVPLTTQPPFQPVAAQLSTTQKTSSSFFHCTPPFDPGALHSPLKKPLPVAQNR